MDVNTPLVLYSCSKQMDESIDCVVPIGIPNPCLPICFKLHKFMVLVLVVDPLMLLPNFVTPHV